MKWLQIVCVLLVGIACKKQEGTKSSPPPSPFYYRTLSVAGQTGTNFSFSNVIDTPTIQVVFSAPVDVASVDSGIYLEDASGVLIQLVYSYPNDTAVSIRPVTALKSISTYTFHVSTAVRSKQEVALQNTIFATIMTAVDSTDKFPRISDSALLDLVQSQTLKYFYDFGHATSGMTRERTSSGDVVTTGGSGFGIMAMLVGAQRNFITRADALSRITEEVNFLTNNATRYHGAFSHWLNGTTGATIPFSPQDDGGDIVETSYMMQGLLCARQFFNSSTDTDEANLRKSINNLWAAVDWNWYRQNGQNVLYWNWSPDYAWAVNVQVGGWCEALITYILAASSPTDSSSIPAIVYNEGWARNGTEKNGNSYYGISLPLGPADGGPLYFAHYSFLGINPTNLSDAYANYWIQDTAHARINYLYCVSNPQHFNGYNSNCWGLTSSDENGGYSAHSPTNDDGVISPTAAISSLPYTPVESMNALKFFYYKLGDKIWGQYGFNDAFNLTNVWFDSDCLAIDQGPEIVMIENYRSNLLWNLFMSCPEIKTGMKKLGFSSPNL